MALADAVEPGRVRLVAMDAGVVGDEFDVVSGATVETVLDLSASGTVEGRVEAPPGMALEGAVIVRDLNVPGLPPNAATVPARPRFDGTFSVRVPGTRPVLLLLTHPTLRPDDASADVAVKTTGSGLVLRLAAAGSVRFTPRVPEADPTRKGLVPRVVATRADAPTIDRFARPEQGAWIVEALPPGDYTLWIDVGVGLPVVRDGVRVATSRVDLGLFDVPAGSAVRLRFADPVPFAVTVTVLASGELSFGRGVELAAGRT